MVADKLFAQRGYLQLKVAARLVRIFHALRNEGPQIANKKLLCRPERRSILVPDANHADRRGLRDAVEGFSYFLRR